MRRAITLIRHGLTDWNIQGRFQGHSDRLLCEEGREQARRLAERTAKFEQIDLVVSSPLMRAVETASIAFPDHVVQTDDRLRELAFGIFEGGTAAENAQKPEWSVWAADPFGNVAPGGESYEQLRQRVVDWFESLPDDLEHIVAVSHSGTIQMLLSHVLGIERPRWRKRIYVRHSSVSRVLLQDGERIVERVNDTRHLDPSEMDRGWA